MRLAMMLSVVMERHIFPSVPDGEKNNRIEMDFVFFRRHVLRIPLFVPRSSSRFQQFLAWILGRRPEFVDPKVIAFNAGRESKRRSSLSLESHTCFSSSDTCSFAWLRSNFVQRCEKRHGCIRLQIRIETHFHQSSTTTTTNRADRKHLCR